MKHFFAQDLRKHCGASQLLHKTQLLLCHGDEEGRDGPLVQRSDISES